MKRKNNKLLSPTS